MLFLKRGGKKMVKKFLSMAIIFIIGLSVSLEIDPEIVSAKETYDPIVPSVTVSTSDNFSGQQNMYFVFDAEYYAKTYPEAVAISGTSFEGLFNHYLTYGIKHGYNACRDFNLDAYKEYNPDLVAIFGDDEENESLYFTHYLTTGKYEGLKSTY